MKRSRRWYLLAGGLILAGLILMALLAPYITRVSPDYRDTGGTMAIPPFPPSAKHWLGTDQFGRDVWSRIAYGARWSLLFAGLIAGARIALALPIGYAAALHRKTAGWLVARLYVLTGAIPPLVIYLFVLRTKSVVMLGLWPNFVFTALLLALVEWPRLAVLFQGRLETLLEQPFIEGAVAAGGTSGHIYRQHLRPHLWPIVLQMAAQELGRALLVLGELGVFGIFAGGGIQEPTEGPRVIFVIVSGVAEWGAMLADTRSYILTAPLAVFAPAAALFLAIAAANWLAQGLEGVSFPLTRWQQATTGRLSRWWRLAWVPALVLAVLWVYQGPPWRQWQSAQAAYQRQMDALRAGDVAAYMADVDPADPDYRLDRERWAKTVTAANWDDTVGTYRGVYAAFGKATAYLLLPPAPDDPLKLNRARQVRMARRWGQWYEVAPPMHAIRGYHVTLETQYAMLDPGRAVIEGRSLQITVSTAADRVYERVAQMMDLRGARRPVVRLYPAVSQFEASIAPATDASVWYVPGKAILVTPDLMKTWNRSRFESLLAQEIVKMATPPGKPMSPLTLGLLTREADGRSTFRPELRTLAGTELSGLDALFRMTPDGLTPARQDSLVTQSALLIDFLGQWLSPSQIAELARSGAGLAELEQAAGVPLKATYADWLYRRVAEESIMTVPAGRQLVPPGLLAQVEARAAGKAGYELLVLNVESQKDGGLDVFLLERDGNGARILHEQWRG